MGKTSRFSSTRLILHLLLFLIAITAGLTFPDSQSSNMAKAQEPEPDVIGVISGSVTGTYAKFAHQMSAVLDGDDIRVLPMLGKGSQQNIRDLLYLNGVDVAIVQSDVLDFYKANQTIPGIEESIRYIGKLYDEEIHIVVPTGLRSIKELEGAIVSVGGAGSGTEMTANTLFDALGISIVPVNVSNTEAVSQLKEGNIGAAVFVLGKPGSIIESIGRDDGLTLLPITLPKTIQGAYFETAFQAADYPNLVNAGTPVPTIAVGAVLAVFNWREGSSRHQAVSRFAQGLVAALDILQDPAVYHPKWGEVNFATKVPGWVRFSAMETLVAQ